MKTTQFTENQIIAMLKQHEQGIKVQDIARAKKIGTDGGCLEIFPNNHRLSLFLCPIFATGNLYL